MRSIHGTPRLTRGFPYTKTPDSKGWNPGVVHTNVSRAAPRWDRSCVVGRHGAQLLRHLTAQFPLLSHALHANRKDKSLSRKAPRSSVLLRSLIRCASDRGPSSSSFLAGIDLPISLITGDRLNQWVSYYQCQKPVCNWRLLVTVYRFYYSHSTTDTILFYLMGLKSGDFSIYFLSSPSVF